ncbi:TPA: hypothetical protein EYP26_05950 [Candidatus Bathyarchaeota archaeon]|nr:hypothetical protein [Candidatus Bathyarchaeota archaeon]
MGEILPKLFLGCSPFVGAGQFGAKAPLYYSKFYLQPRNMVKLFEASFKLGVTSIQLLSDRPAEALIEASKRLKVRPYVVYSTDLKGEALREALKKLNPLELAFVAVHAEVSDRLNVNKIFERKDVIDEFGCGLGVATHNPGATLPWIEESKVPARIILAPLNKLGYLMKPSFKEALNAIKRSSKSILAIKPLAAGRLKPQEAFGFVYRYAKSAAVGVASEEEMKETFEAAAKALKRA